ncbi:hypothetical protein Csa_014090 [Cucumis sativus]|nr:hypothetical protein Csa_014090 [Cucumis sativus]
MSGRSRSRQSSSVRISDEQITDLVHKLQQLLPEIRNRHSDKVFQQQRSCKRHAITLEAYIEKWMI